MIKLPLTMHACATVTVATPAGQQKQKAADLPVAETIWNMVPSMGPAATASRMYTKHSRNKQQA
jgi:hypothetical protein